MSAAKKDRLLYNAFAVLSHPERSGWDKFFFFKVYASYRQDQKRLRAKIFQDRIQLNIENN